MKPLAILLRLVLVWLLPAGLALASLAVAFALWLAGTQEGSRLLLSAVARQFEGEARDVEGSVLRGLRVGHLRLAFDGTGIQADGLKLDVDWSELARRHLLVRELSADLLSVALGPAEEAPAPQEPGQGFALPLPVTLERLALGEFELTRDGRSLLPVAVGGLAASLSGDAQGVRVQVDEVRADHGRWVLRGGARLDPALAPQALSADLMQDGRAVLSAQLSRTRLEREPGAARPDAALPAAERIRGSLQADRFDLGGLLGADLPQAVLSAHADFDADVIGMGALARAGASLSFEEGSRWNGQPLSGRLSLQAAADDAAAEAAAAEAGAAQPAGLPSGWRLDELQADLRLGANRVAAQGRLGAGEGSLSLQAQAPSLAAFWPGLPGGASLDARVDGTAARHRATLKASYDPAAGARRAQPAVPGRAPIQAEAALEGGWQAPAGEPAGWRGTVSKLSVASAGYAAALESPASLAWLPGAAAPRWMLQVGATRLALTLPGRQRIVLAHEGSRLGAGRWETAGRADELVITRDLVRQLRAAFDPQAAQANAAGGAAGRARPPQPGLPQPRLPQPGLPQPGLPQPGLPQRLVLDAMWNLRFDGALSGRASVARRGGDLRVPASPPIALGLQALALDVSATPTGPGASRLAATLDVRTEKMGTLRGQADAVLAGLGLNMRQPAHATLDADMSDLSWVDLFTGDAMEVNGALVAHVRAQHLPSSGDWSAEGEVNGSKLRLLRIDDGVRLLDGTLRARFEGNQVILESLRFPAVQRVPPAHARTRDWLATPEAQGGYVEARGQWDIPSSRGRVDVTLSRYPVLQRSDRYVMASGRLALDAALPRLSLTGRIEADAGWASLEVLRGVPVVDDDVRIVRPGAQAPGGEAGPPMQLDMDVEVDVGRRFFLTGMGLDAGLTGSLHVLMRDGVLRGMGALRTRDGTIQAYGQRLQLRRGVITFQGRLDNPLLDIEALRTDTQQVQAGVRVAGTAQRPRIDLISYPDVSDVEKLSWLVMGRGPDSSGSDTALLLSVGASLLGGGEPFFKQFGLDDVSMRTGSLGSSGSLLPDRTVAGDVNRSSESDLATQFIVASKRFANGITLSVEQAMSGTETVGRASYRLARGLSLDAKGGGVNGLALVYRWFLDD